MLSGRRLNLLDPSPLDVEISDIAHGLARVARWNGQTRGDHSFSVAQHAVLVKELAVRMCPDLPRTDRLIVLLHDAPEYVIGDMISPFKAVIGSEYKDVEARLMTAIHLRFGLTLNPAKSLIRLTKRADSAAAYLEATRLAGFDETEARKIFGRHDDIARTIQDSYMQPWPASEAQTRFLDRFSELMDA